MKLVNNWRAAPRMWSVWCFAAILGITLGWLAASAVLGTEYLVGAVGQTVIAVLAFVGGVLRIVAQPTTREEAEDRAAGV